MDAHTRAYDLYPEPHYTPEQLSAAKRVSYVTGRTVNAADIDTATLTMLTENGWGRDDAKAQLEAGNSGALDYRRRVIAIFESIGFVINDVDKK